MSVQVPYYDYFDWNTYVNYDDGYSAVLYGENPVSMEQMRTNDLGYAFFNQTTFNKKVKIAKGVTNCYEMFYNCFNFNQPVIMPSSVTNYESMFKNCYNFNQSVIIPNGGNSCREMFYQCYKLNGKSIRIPDSVTSCQSMFYNCRNYSTGSIVVGKNVQSMQSFISGGDIPTIFIESNKLAGQSVISGAAITVNYSTHGALIYINKTCQGSNFCGLLGLPDNHIKHIVYCNNLSWINGTGSNANSITGAAITWTSTTNGYYNATKNLYLYRNYTG